MNSKFIVIWKFATLHFYKFRLNKHGITILALAASNLKVFILNINVMGEVERSRVDRLLLGAVHLLRDMILALNPS